MRTFCFFLLFFCCLRSEVSSLLFLLYSLASTTSSFKASIHTLTHKYTNIKCRIVQFVLNCVNHFQINAEYSWSLHCRRLEQKNFIWMFNLSFSVRELLTIIVFRVWKSKTICSLKFKEVYIINSLCLFSLLCLSPGYERGIKRSSGWACGGTRLGPEDPATLSLHQTACEVLPASQPSNPTPQPRPCSQTTCSTCEGQSRECRQQPQLLSRARDTETFPKLRCPVWEDPPDHQCLRE